MKNTRDVINGNYYMHTNTGLNVIKSYCDLAIKRTCRCMPSWSLLRHGQLRGRLTTISEHLVNLVNRIVNATVVPVHIIVG